MTAATMPATRAAFAGSGQLPSALAGGQRGGDQTASVERALLVLELIASDPAPVRLSDLARTLDACKATVRRTLRSLLARGFASRAGRCYAVGARLYELACQAWVTDPDRLMAALMPFVVDLYWMHPPTRRS